MTSSTDQISRILAAIGVRPATAALYVPHLGAAVRVQGIQDSALAMLLAQLAHESAMYERTAESLSYGSAEQIRKTWPTRFSRTWPQALRALVRNPEALANRVYANRLGNGPESSGDGWRFRGRGLIQITGRANYAEVGAALGLPLLDDPGLLEEPAHAAMSAAWYWQRQGLSRYADDVEGCTRAINGGSTGLAERRRLFEAARGVVMSE